MSYSKTLSHKAQYSGGFKQVNGRSNNTAAYNHNYYQQNKELWKTKYGRSAKVSDDEKRKAEVTRNISQQEKDFLKDVDEYLKKSGRDPEEFLKSQDFRLTLAEFGGYDPDKIRGADVGYFTGNYRNYFGIKGEEDEYWESKTKGDLMTGGMPTSAKDAMTEAYIRKARQQSGVKPLNRGNRMGNGMPSNIKKKKVEHSDVSKGEYYAVTYSSDLSHHGILGQKWGVRRYRNYDGSLTQRGLDRYRKTEKNYEYSKNKYKATKAKYKQGQASKLDVKNAKYIMKEDKKTMNKYYKQLHKDYMADKGKELYREGKRISTRGKLFGQIASGAATATAILGYMGKADLAKKAALISAGSGAAYGLINAYAELPFGDNARLRAYYAHKSLPDVTVKGERSGRPTLKEPKESYVERRRKQK